jgi:hypothetical protein
MRAEELHPIHPVQMGAIDRRQLREYDDGFGPLTNQTVTRVQPSWWRLFWPALRGRLTVPS